MKRRSSRRADPTLKRLLRRAHRGAVGMVRAGASRVGRRAADALVGRVDDQQSQMLATLRRFSEMWAEVAEKGGLEPEEWARALRDATGLGGPPSPGFGFSREHQARLGSLMRAWWDQKSKELVYQRYLSQAWSKAFLRTVEDMDAKARKSESISRPEDFLEAWVKVADEVFTDLFKTEEFARAQAEALNAGHRVRRGRRELSEGLLQACDLPTQTDLEEAHKGLYALRREVRALQSELAALKKKSPTRAKKTPAKKAPTP